jgi:ABC-type nickel/cobalt efflux system permease component RcnA
MTELSVVTTLSLGFLLGARHALDADHLAAVSTIIATQRDLKASGLVGACWGVGHTVTLLLIGLGVIALGFRIPPSFSAACETAVGIMLILLGGSLAWNLWRDRWHVHPHVHDGQAHLHLHTHRTDAGHRHDHDGRAFVKPIFVGMVHGLAGSAALILLLLATVRTLWEGLAYIVAFGVGSIVAMGVIGTMMSLPIVWSTERGRHALVAVQAVACLSSILLGVMTLATQLPLLALP